MVGFENFALIRDCYSLALRDERNNTASCAAFYLFLNYCTKADQSNCQQKKVGIFSHLKY